MPKRRLIAPSERRYARSKEEVQFEELLKEHGFEIRGIREYISKTDYELVKGDISFCVNFGSSVVSVKKFFELYVLEFYKIYEENKSLKALAMS